MKLILISMACWAVFSFFSNSLLATHHVLLFAGFAALVYQSRSWPRPSYSAICLAALIFFAILSVFLNFSDLRVPWNKILKTKYLLAGLVLHSICRHYAAALARYRFVLLLFFLVSFFVAVVWGLLRLATTDDPFYRPSGFFGMMLSYAYTAQFTALLLAFLAFNPQIKLLPTRTHLLSFIDNTYFRWSALVVVGINLYLAQTRGPLLGILVCAPLLLFWKNRKIFYALGAVGVLLISFVVWNSFSGAVQSNNRIYMSAKASPNMDRVSQYQMAWIAFKQAPVFGLGWRSLDERSVGIKVANKLPFPDNASHAHNNYLEVAATTGIFGFLAFLGWLGFWFIEAVVKNSSPWRVYYLAIIVAFALSGLFQSTLIDSEFSFSLFALYGLAPLFTEGKSRKIF